MAFKVIGLLNFDTITHISHTNERAPLPVTSIVTLPMPEVNNVVFGALIIEVFFQTEHRCKVNCLLLFCILETIKAISEWVPTCSAHSWRIYSAATQGNQAAITMTDNRHIILTLIQPVLSRS